MLAYVYVSPFMLSGFCSNTVDISVLLGYAYATMGNWCPVFCGRMVVSSSRDQKAKKKVEKSIHQGPFDP
jgi:hypothetical protein